MSIIANQNMDMDNVAPFLLNNTAIRGKITRLAISVDKIIKQHEYPDCISKILAELLVIATLIGESLKNQDSKVIIQAETKGIIKLIVADFVYGGKIRGYTNFDQEKLAEFIKYNQRDPQADELFQGGNLVITIFNTAQARPYQGIIAIKNNNLSESIEQYFKESEQIDTIFKIDISKKVIKNLIPFGIDNSNIPNTGYAIWHAGGIMIQKLPEKEAQESEWEHAKILLDTITTDEFHDNNLPLKQILYRLYHEDGVWVYEPKKIEHTCRCSRERAEVILNSIPEEEKKELRVNGALIVKCEFCNKEEVFY